MTAAADLTDLRARVDAALGRFLDQQRQELAGIDSTTVALMDSLESMVRAGGKRLRPAFGYWGYRAAGGPDSEALVATVAALELVQASALIHDDIIDGSDTRRGVPAAHRQFAAQHRDNGWHGDPAAYGRAAAILLGDLSLVWSDRMLHTGGLPAAVVARARPVFDQMRAEVTVGQYLDILHQATADPSTDRAVLVARLKSAKYTVERPLLLGAALAGAPATVTGAYARYGLSLGEAFQLRDDVLGVFGDPSRTGKPAGDDLREGKRTFLVAAAVEAGDRHARALLAARLGDPALDDDGIRQLRDTIVKTGALERTEQRIRELTAAALAALEPAPLCPQGREALVGLAVAATERTG